MPTAAEAACLGMSALMTHRQSHQLCQLLQKLRPTPHSTLRRSHQQVTWCQTPLKTLKRSHQQATPTPDSLADQWSSHQLCQPPQKLRPTHLRTLRRSHQQETLTLTLLTHQRKSHQLHQSPQKHLILIISRPTCSTYFLMTTKFYCLYIHLLMFPHRTPKVFSSQCNCNGFWPFSPHAWDGALF